MANVVRLWAILVLPSFVAAQPAPENRTSETTQADPEQEAQQLFESALEFLDREQWPEARDRLERSLELSPRASTAYNLGIARRGAGNIREAVAVFEALLDERFGELSEAQRDDIEANLDRARTQLGTLSVRVRGVDEVIVFLDGIDVGVAAPELEMRVDPGSHQLRLVAESMSRAEHVQIQAGERVTLPIVFAPPPRAIAQTANPPDHGSPDRGVIRRRRALAVTSTVVGLAVVALIVVRAFSSRSATRDPVTGQAVLVP